MEAKDQTQIQQVSLPNSTIVLVFGILSIALCWCHGFFGLILGIVALILVGKDMALYQSNPDHYTPVSISNTRTGRTTAIIGVILSSLWLVVVLIYLLIFGAAFSLIPWELYID
ncbi:MAG: hypothetical protein JW861_00560 [Bacteroidales bacterium]|nr:hypothetical protein [Bacteroidales bacterium]